MRRDGYSQQERIALDWCMLCCVTPIEIIMVIPMSPHSLLLDDLHTLIVFRDSPHKDVS